MVKNNNKTLKNASIGFAVLIAGILIGVILLFSVYKISTSRVSMHIAESASVLYKEGTYTKIVNGGQLDNWTDATMMNIILYKGDNFSDDMLLAQRMTGNKSTPVENLYDYVTGAEKNSYGVGTYARYWHGYQVILTPLLMFFNILGIRSLNMLVQLSLIIGMIVLLCAKKRFDMLVPFVLMYFSLVPISLFCSLQFSSTFYVMAFLLLALLLKYDKWSFGKICCLFEVTGIMEAYFDFLTYPFVSLGVPLIMYFALDTNNKTKLSERIKQFLILCISWGFGYIGMWAGKWVVASVFTDSNVIAEAITAIKFRSSTSYNDNIFTFAGAVKHNFDALNNGAFKIMIAFSAVVWLFFVYKRRKTLNKSYVNTLILVCLCSLLPFLRYLVTINHASIHYWFTFRELAVFVYGIMTALYLLLYKKEIAVQQLIECKE